MLYILHPIFCVMCDVSGQRFFSKHPPELTDPVTVGVGFKGISVHKAKKNAPQQFAWNAIHAIAYRKNLVLLKLHRVSRR